MKSSAYSPPCPARSERPVGWRSSPYRASAGRCIRFGVTIVSAHAAPHLRAVAPGQRVPLAAPQGDRGCSSKTAIRPGPWVGEVQYVAELGRGGNAGGVDSPFPLILLDRSALGQLRKVMTRL